MDEIKAPESPYSAERTAVTGSDSLRGEKAVAIAGGREAPAPVAPAEKTVTTKNNSTVNAEKGPWEERPPAARQNLALSPLASLVDFLQRTWMIWAGAAAVLFVTMAAVSVQKGMAERARLAKEARQEQAVATVTVDTLLARCGTPAEDVTKEMYPMILRTMIYQPRENEQVVFQFSRTAEEKSDWVFLSMRNGSATKNYDTTQAKIAALPCLDLKK